MQIILYALWICCRENAYFFFKKVHLFWKYPVLKICWKQNSILLYTNTQPVFTWYHGQSWNINSCIRFLFAMYGSKMTFHIHQCFTDGDGLVNDPWMLPNHSVDGDYSCKHCKHGLWCVCDCKNGLWCVCIQEYVIFYTIFLLRKLFESFCL